MNKRSKISHNLGITALLAAMLLSYACSKSGMLSKNDVADIMYEMFLADEYAKKYPKINKAADSLLLYQHIFDKYGCSLEDYRNSIKFYIGDEKAYTYILKRAVQTAKDSASRANKEVGKEQPRNITAIIPYPSEGMEIPMNKWWNRKIDGSYPTKTGFYDELQSVIREAQENERRRKRELLKGKADSSEPEIVLTKEAQKIRDNFRRNMEEIK
ncbi:MAG: DUF4296 domain-containing protein [Bacteroidales bacterium]|nr:DUF4296 domain-containing protein [Bacteroidales bacterium]